MTLPVAEDLERLASILALLTSEDGEAENAGRAAGHLAHQMGLSGGHLKAIFLAGAEAAGLRLPDAPAASDAQVRRLEQELAELRHLVDQSDAERLAVLAERIALLDRNEALTEALDRTRSARQVWRVAVVVLLAAALAGGVLAVFGPGLPFASTAAPKEAAAGTAFGRMAVAGAAGAHIVSQPDLAAPVIATLPPGSAVPVRRLFWQSFRQWVEIDVAGQTGYTPATDLDMR